MYIDYMRVIAPVPWADDEVVGEWRIDGVSEFSKIFKLRGNKSVNPSWCSFLVISFPDINVRRRQVSLTVSASKQREQFQVCAAKLDLSDFSIDPAFKLHTVRLNGTQGIGSVLEVGMHTASQPRWMHGQQVIPRSTASFVKPQADAQAQLLHSHVLEQTANAATLASAEDVSVEVEVWRHSKVCGKVKRTRIQNWFHQLWKYRPMLNQRLLLCVSFCVRPRLIRIPITQVHVYGFKAFATSQR